MSNRTGMQKLARSIQRVAFEEFGKRPKYMVCLGIATRFEITCVPLGESESREVKATRLVLKYRDELLRNAEP